ncbi:glucose 1-dehydrogenase [Anabaena cylindrica FACHB-243]|uniref:3-oxoacyl-(Acyl-carrier-protein) reductase n=1 Tax=Anabaena cylindrica (strain ATCC 27899 / PCC 7122) TaxID=272123 RepID=K9ZIR7_ANACC|nr:MULTISPECIES: glucose 1-dehydrogenase [Anabaena]AFZ58457.1 3-oxoacyl-(acyl-carrier-protein) reductase [Anabaena cylindrica PCC 7122]MBD2417320.1 glucose 1-dehydrogenase [Anabaena cylindrica FACHB-243]MBY5282428.1 glucose 1-dehydrogenase [Anabaena sp. CCAP 1446/1C]MBY5308773.1 glucose 1-dehydrogenase [Anabaena sp. CCAP 1446/1C]MCM2410117.1 glucose 1-dehydrogenase [Anabaena sp. CCAP 1446/1C]
MKPLENKVALVTGGTSGIGRTTAIAFAHAGAKVVVVGRREEEGSETVNLIHQAGSEGLFVKADVSQEADIKATIAAVVDKFGRLDIAFNNAGLLGENALLAEQTEQTYDRVFGVNVKGVFLCMKHEITQMLAQGNGGAIVNTSSINGFRPLAPGLSIYDASKTAVVMLTKAAALEYASQKIRINAIAPGPIETEMLSQATGGNTKAFENFVPAGRLGKPDDIANAVIWLSSDATNFVNGHTLVVDGGLLAA